MTLKPAKLTSLFQLVVVGFAAVTISSCTKNKQVPAAETAAPAVTETTETKPVEAKAEVCPDGSAPKIVQGSCTGKWIVRSQPEGLTCEFEWGPKVTCPAGTKSMTYEAACYGNTVKPDSASRKLTTPAECQSAYGDMPQNPAYTLSCCPGA